MKKINLSRFSGLNLKIFIVFVLCMLIPMLVSLFASSFLSEKYLEQSSRNELLNIADEKRNQFELALTDLGRQAQSIALQPNIVETLSEAKNNSTQPSEKELDNISKNLQSNFELGENLFENIYVMYKNKIVVDGVKGTSIGWENEEVGGAETLILRPARLSPITNRPVITLVTPITNNDKHLGTVAMAIELNNMSQKIIDNNNSDDKLNTFILNADGLVLSSTVSDYVFTLDFQDEVNGLQDFYQAMNSDKIGTGFFTQDGVDYIAAYSYSNQFNMYILTYKPVSEYMVMIDNLKNILLIVILLSILVTSIVIYITSRRITKPILVVAEQAELMSYGDLSLNMPPNLLNRRDEIGKLSKSFAIMIENFRNIISKLSTTSEQVAASSQQLHASGEQVGTAAEEVGRTILDIASGAEKQSNKIESTHANLNDLINQINEVNMSSNHMEKTTGLMIDDIGRGRVSIAESVNRINELKVETEDASKVIYELGNTSNQIGKITELIGGIAKQTSLLSLNASIEAARAGEAGKGFSVVADEIRKLASESADASRRIESLILDIRNGVDTAVIKMDSSVKSLNSSIQAIEENGTVFFIINEQAERLKDIVANVTHSVDIMTESSREFERTMQEINETSHEFAANSEQVSAASEEQIALTNEIVSSSKAMADMSEELAELIQKFKL